MSLIIGAPNEAAKSAVDSIQALSMSGLSESNLTTIRSIFNGTSCYDLMQISYKAIVFEVTIPFQLAFYAMVEHDTEVAPLWNPDKQCFVGLMTIFDYIQALHVCISRGIPMIDLSSKAITDMLSSPIMAFQHPTFEPLDAEESTFQLYRALRNSNADYVPIIDPDKGNLVSVLGYMDLLRLLVHASKQYPNLFIETLEQMGIGTFQNLWTATKSTRLHEVLSILLKNDVAGVPVLDENGRVYSYYHKSDVTFVTKAADPEAILVNLAELTMGEAVAMRDQLQQSGEAMSTTQSLVTCASTDSISAVLHAMMVYRVARVVCVDSNQICKGIISLRDILSHYCGRVN